MRHLKWNEEHQAFLGTTSNGKAIRVETVEIAEVSDAVNIGLGEISEVSVFCTPDEMTETEKTLLDSDLWETLIDTNQNVSYTECPLYCVLSGS